VNGDRGCVTEAEERADPFPGVRKWVGAAADHHRRRLHVLFAAGRQAYVSRLAVRHAVPTDSAIHFLHIGALCI
jgi:hypothetical protein